MRLLTTSFLWSLLTALGIGCIDPPELGPPPTITTDTGSDADGTANTDTGSDIGADAADAADAAGDVDGAADAGPVDCLYGVETDGSCLEVVKLDTRNANSCAMLSNGEVWCWGSREYGQLGDFAMAFSPSGPQRMDTKFGHPVVDFAVAYAFILFVLDNGDIVGMGWNQFGQLGVTGPNFQVAPVVVTDIKHPAKLWAGYNAACAQSSLDGLTYCWGQPYDDPQFPPPEVQRPDPYPVDVPTPKAMALGSDTACALSGDDASEIYCWGKNPWGAAAFPSATHLPTPTKIGLTDVADLATAGQIHHCALMKDGRVACWGGNDGGQVGNGNQSNVFSPYFIPDVYFSPHKVAYLRNAFRSSCAAMEDGSVYCWGLNNSRLADSTQHYQLQPKKGPDLTGDQLGVGHLHACLLRHGDGAIVCWGDNTAGAITLPVGYLDSPPTVVRFTPPP